MTGGAIGSLFASSFTSNVELMSLFPETDPVPACWKTNVKSLPVNMHRLVSTSFEDCEYKSIQGD